MFKSLIMWLNIQLFQFLITDYPRYKQEWSQIREKLEAEDEEKQSVQTTSRVCKDEADDRNSSIPPSSGWCDVNFNKDGHIDYDDIPIKLERYKKWCNDRYFRSLRSPLAIIHEMT